MADLIQVGRADMAFADGVLILSGLVLLTGLGTLAFLRFRDRVLGVPWRMGLHGLTTAAGFCTVQAVIVDQVVDAHGPPAIDISAWSWFLQHRGLSLNTAMIIVSEVGSTAGMAVLATLATCVLAWRGRRDQAVVVALAGLGAAAMVKVLKHLYGRPRPPLFGRLVVETSNSLPSGHALASFVVLGVLTLLGWRYVKSAAVRGAIMAATLTVVGLIGVSRLYLGVHWTTDVLVSWLIGAAWLTICFTAVGVMRTASGSTGPLGESTAVNEFASAGRTESGASDR